jgi:hypothetical protein
MKNQNVVTEVKKLNADKLFNKLKNDLMVRLQMTEEAATEQAGMITGTFIKAQMA